MPDDDKRDEAWQRLRAQVPADDLGDAQIIASRTFMAASARAQRAALRRVADRLRRFDVDGLRADLAAAAGFTAAPDTYRDVVAILEAGEAVARGVEAARAAIPPSARLSRRPRDEVDDAPSVARVKGKIAEAVPLPGGGAPLRDLAVAVGIEPPPSDAVDEDVARDRWAKLAKRRRRAAK